MLHIGIVGMGGIGNNHARCYTANENAKIVAVCDMVKEQADAGGRVLWGRGLFYSVEEMVASGLRLDAWFGDHGWGGEWGRSLRADDGAFAGRHSGAGREADFQ